MLSIAWRVVAVVSLLLCVALVVLWALSYARPGSAVLYAKAPTGCAAAWSHGQLEVTVVHDSPGITPVADGAMSADLIWTGRWPGAGQVIRERGTGFSLAWAERQWALTDSVLPPQYWRVSCPLWFLVMLTALAPAARWLARMRQRRRARPGGFEVLAGGRHK